MTKLSALIFFKKFLTFIHSSKHNLSVINLQKLIEVTSLKKKEMLEFKPLGLLAGWTWLKKESLSVRIWQEIFPKMK